MVEIHYYSLGSFNSVVVTSRNDFLKICTTYFLILKITQHKKIIIKQILLKEIIIKLIIM